MSIPSSASYGHLTASEVAVSAGFPSSDAHTDNTAVRPRAGLFCFDSPPAAAPANVMDSLLNFSIPQYSRFFGDRQRQYRHPIVLPAEAVRNNCRRSQQSATITVPQTPRHALNICFSHGLIRQRQHTARDTAQLALREELTRSRRRFESAALSFIKRVKDI